MDFFEAQDQARRKSKWLLLYFAFGVLGVTAAVSALTFGALLFTGAKGSSWPVILPVALVTMAVIVAASLFKSMQLSAGGAVVATDLGGRLVDPGTSDARERRLLNVVSEMAIASGSPVPQVYVLDDEESINAFAAGTEPSNAVIGVTRGCVDRLSRAELQGVIAHEFSHILNGDMRLNMRLIGVVFGILVLMIIGRTVVFSLRHVRTRDSKAGGAILVVLLVGLGLMLIGWVGVVFARLIQAAVSRQREFLADASAVQFTREPDGIAGALKKIGGLSEGSRVRSPKALEASHMFFSEGGMFTWGFRTHPPLDIRIRRIQASWDGEFTTQAALPEIESGPAPGPPPLPGASAGALSALAAVNHLADGQRARMEIGARIQNGLDSRWVEATRNRDGAQTLIFALLLAEDDTLQQGEITHLEEAVGAGAAEAARSWHAELVALHSSSKIALVDLCIPSLRRMSHDEYARFVETMHWLIASDRSVDLFEYMLQHVVARHLASHFESRGIPRIRYGRMSDLAHEANVLCSAMARMDRDGPQAAEAFGAVQGEWGKSEKWEPRLLDPGECDIRAVHEALDKFEFASPILKRQILRVCGLAAAHDDVLESREIELLRAIGDAIGASIPPFVDQLAEA